MLEKYLKLVCKGKQVGKIVPIIKKGETLAYYVEFSNNLGWNLIAADTRVTPVLSESPTGYLVFQDEGPVNGILGTLKNVIDIVDNTYFLMNWGYDGDCDDVTYLARAKQYYYNEDFSSLYYVTEGYSSMSWEIDDYNYTVFDSMLYNFRRKN